MIEEQIDTIRRGLEKLRYDAEVKSGHQYVVDWANHLLSEVESLKREYNGGGK